MTHSNENARVTGAGAEGAELGRLDGASIEPTRLRFNFEPPPSHHYSDIYLPDVGTVEAAILFIIRNRRDGGDGECKPADVGLAQNPGKFSAHINALNEMGWPVVWKKRDTVHFEVDGAGCREWFDDQFFSGPDGICTWTIWYERQQTHLIDGSVTGWKLYTIGDLMAQPDDMKMLVSGVLECGTTACLFGPSESGKSLIAVGLATCISAGQPWHGHATTQGPVIYLCAEGHAGLKRRFRASAIDRGVVLEKLPIVISDSAVDVRSAGLGDYILNACDGVPPVLIVVDTLVRHLPAGAAENSGQDVGPIIDSLEALGRRFGATVLILHHVGHTANGRERGWSGIRAAMDFSYSVSKAGDTITMRCAKSKDHAPPEPMQFAVRQVELPLLTEDGKTVVSVVLDLADAAQPIAGKNQGVALEKLRALVEASGSDPVLVEMWRKETGLSRQRWAEVRKSLVKSGEVILEDDFVSLPNGPK